MSESAPRLVRNPCCPRCGYDQRGAIDTWIESCPVQGACSECGLSFAWADVLIGGRVKPRWCVEYARSAPDLVRRSFATVVMTLFLPWRFWASLRMSHRFRPIRALWIIAPLITMGYVVFAGSVAYRSYLAAANWTPAVGVTDWDRGVAAAWAFALPWSDHSPMAKKVAPFPPPRWFARRYHIYPRPLAILASNYAWKRTRYSEWLFPCAAMLVICPMSFLLLPASLRAARVRRVHLIRIALYSATLFIMPWSLDIVKQLVRHDRLERVTIEVIFGLMLAIWWSCAARNYLKLPHFAAVGASVVLLSYLFQRTIFELAWFVIA